MSRSRSLPLAAYALLALASVAGRALFSPIRQNEFSSSIPVAAGQAIERTPSQPPAQPLHNPRAWWTLIRDTASAWMAHKAAKQGAALAYYSISSLGPLLVIATIVAGLVFGQEAVRGEVSTQLASVLGDQGAKGVETMLAGADKPREGIFP